MDAVTQEWISILVVLSAAGYLLWRYRIKPQSACNDCHKSSKAGQPKAEFRGIKVTVKQ